MLMRLLFDEDLAQAAYLIGCPSSGEAIVIDPERDIDRYIDAAKREKLRIVAVAETHIHADFLSGTRELAERTGAKVYLPGQGGPGWEYGWLNQRAGGGSYPHHVLRHGDTFKIGGVEIKALHTPGHTPEHMAFLITDRGSGAQEPMGLVSGDFVFVGDLGRPDLLETAAGQQGTKEAGAGQLFESVRQFIKLPEYLQVWPGHGAGSSCGKALGAVPQTTVGYEKRFNPAITAAETQSGFIDFILSGQPEPPSYFARMKRLNRDGPPLLGKLPTLRAITSTELRTLDFARIAVLDTRDWGEFKAGHLPRALRDPLDKTFSTVAASYVPEAQDVYVVVPAAKVEEAVRALVRVGVDRVVGYIEPAAIAEYAATGGPLEKAAEVDVASAQAMLESGVLVLDVRRRADEFDPGHIPGAVCASYTRLAEHLGELPRGREVLVNCKSGGRSSRAVSYLQAHGFQAANLAGGFDAWAAAGGAIEVTKPTRDITPKPAHPHAATH